MGVTDCEKHGRVGFVEVCHHVATAIDKCHYGEFHRIGFFLGNLLLCDECFEKFRCDFKNYPRVAGKSLEQFIEMEEEESETLLKEFEPAYENIPGRSIVCAECLAVAQVEQARHDQAPPPFAIFEKTLTSHQQASIDQLYRQLTSRFQFRPSTITPNKLAIFIGPGAYTYPLTITIYFVTDLAVQDRIVDDITQFLGQQKLNQARVKFYEAQVWHTWSNPAKGTSGGRQGHEILLNEVYLNCQS